MPKSPNNIKVCFAASSGGHLDEVLALRPLMERYDSFILTEKTKYDADFPVRARYVAQVNRREVSLLPRMLANFIASLKIWHKEKPDVIVCVGALATIPFCLIGHLHGAKLVFIESFAKTSSPTMTGRLLHKYADRFYVQWDSMLPVYPDARFVGGIY